MIAGAADAGLRRAAERGEFAADVERPSSNSKGQSLRLDRVLPKPDI